MNLEKRQRRARKKIKENRQKRALGTGGQFLKPKITLDIFVKIFPALAAYFKGERWEAEK